MVIVQYAVVGKSELKYPLNLVTNAVSICQIIIMKPFPSLFFGCMEGDL